MPILAWRAIMARVAPGGHEDVSRSPAQGRFIAAGGMICFAGPDHEISGVGEIACWAVRTQSQSFSTFIRPIRSHQ